MSLEQELREAILEICARAAAEKHVSPISLQSGVDDVRALASRLLERHGQTSPGFRQLVQAGRFDLTFESLVLQGRFRTLFSHAERVEARARLIDAIAAALNAAARGRPIGTLQASRAERRDLRTVPALFGGDDIRRNDGYAYHAGGGDELQFHVAVVGFDREPWLRYGVGFALSRSRRETGLSAFAPKIDRFNEFLRAYPGRFAHLRIQHHRHGEVSTYEPGPIPRHFLRPPVFIFLGIHIPFEELSIEGTADLFDALMPLYHYVETGTDMPGSAPTDPRPGEQPRAPPERRPGLRFTVDRVLRRQLLHTALIAHLEAQYGSDCVVSMEGGGHGPTADAAVSGDGVITYYGVSPALTVRGCLREVLGRLLEGALWSDVPQPAILVVVGEVEPNAADLAYLERLRAQLGVAVQYRQIDLASGRLD
jgi:hypothetical protein